jgi:hypothetical protein
MNKDIFDIKILLIFFVMVVVYFVFKEMLKIKKDLMLTKVKIDAIINNNLKLQNEQKNKIEPKKNNKNLNFNVTNNKQQIEMVNEKQENLVEDQQNEEKIVPFVDSTNNTSEHLEIYSNDNCEYNNFSINDSTEINSEIIKEIKDDTKTKNIDDFMKKKLVELQCMAEENKIDITNDSGKKKTKLELSNDLIKI